MRGILILTMLAGCTGSPNYWRAYTPMHGTTSAERASAVQKVTIAVTDAGKEIESSDATTGIVLTKWFSGDGFGQDQSRFRIRVVFDEAKGYDVVALCQSKDGGDWKDGCGDKRPQFVLDAMAKVDGALR